MQTQTWKIAAGALKKSRGGPTTLLTLSIMLITYKGVLPLSLEEGLIAINSQRRSHSDNQHGSLAVSGLDVLIDPHYNDVNAERAEFWIH